MVVAQNFILKALLVLLIEIKQSELSKFPYYVSIQSRPDHFHHCSGTLIGWNHVLTAAHCVVITEFHDSYMVREEKHFRILAGDLRGNGKYEKNKRQIRYISEIMLAPNHDSLKAENDLAIIRVDQRFNESETVNIIPISRFTPKYTGQCFLTGLKANKKEVHDSIVRIRAKRYCNLTYHGKVPKFTICAFSNKTLKEDDVEGRLQCDSGGPLVCNEYLSGIVSFGFGCDVYTDVSKFIKWINSIVIETRIKKLSAATTNMRSTNVKSNSSKLNIDVIVTILVILNIGRYLLRGVFKIKL